jgi:hypothetical protein
MIRWTNSNFDVRKEGVRLLCDEKVVVDSLRWLLCPFAILQDDDSTIPEEKMQFPPLHLSYR